MDFVDIFDIDSANAKCKRVRSWYLYEQYKSLEKNQLDAAQRLKKKSYQEKILRQELTERRARRRLCDQFGLCQSESRLHLGERSIPSNVLSDDDLYESLRDEYEFENYEDNNSHDSQRTTEFEDFKSTETKKVYTESINSVIENTEIGQLDDCVEEKFETIKNDIADNITLQLRTVKENIECLEKYTKLKDDEEIPNIDIATLNVPLKSDFKSKKDRGNNFIRVWSKFVDFAYKIINLNRGNCYYDCSLQLLTAVLACDILLRGVNTMCNILQPYVTPIKFATSDSETSLISNKKIKTKKSVYRKFHNANSCVKPNLTNNNKYNKRLRNFGENYHSEDEWYNRCNSFGSGLNEIKYRGASEPLRSTPKYDSGKRCSKNCNSKWQTDLVKDNFCNCHRLKSTVSPMMQLACCLESLLQDIEEFN